MGIPFWEKKKVYGWYYFAHFREMQNDNGMRDRKEMCKIIYCRICEKAWENINDHNRGFVHYYTKQEISFYKLKHKICRKCNADILEQANQSLQRYELARKAEEMSESSALQGED